MKMFASGDRASWLNSVAAKIMDGGSTPPSIDRLRLIVPPDIVTKENDGHVTAAAKFGEVMRQNYQLGWSVIIDEMVAVLREQGFVGGSEKGLTWIKPVDGLWKIAMPDGALLTVFGQRERRMSRDRSIVGERSEVDGSRMGAPSPFETGRMHPIELLVESSRGKITPTKFEIHPLATIIPSYTEREREGLRADIEKNGIKVPLVIYQKKILDGRNRGYWASQLKRTVRIMEFDGSEEEARRLVISLNVVRRHLNAVQLAILAEELYGERADAIVAEAHRLGSIKGNQSRSPVVLISAQPGDQRQAPKRNDIVAELATADGIKTTRYAVAGIQELLDAPETLALVKSGKYHKTRDAVTAALKEKGKDIPRLLPEITPRSVNERLGICIDNLNRILTDCNMQPGNAMPVMISERIREINRLTGEVERELRERRVIT